MVEVSYGWEFGISDRREWHFEVHGKSWIFAGFTLNSGAENFNMDAENMLVLNCHKVILDIFENPNRYERRLARMEGIPLDFPATKRLYNNVLYINDRDRFCFGSGGIGGGKVFWTPYTSEDLEIRQRVVNSDVHCDNCRVVAHEDLHGIGSHVELDSFSVVAGIVFRLKYLPEEEWGWSLRDRISFGARKALEYLRGRRRDSLMRENRNLFYAVYQRCPEEVVKVLVEEGFSDTIIDEVIENV